MSIASEPTVIGHQLRGRVLRLEFNDGAALRITYATKASTGQITEIHLTGIEDPLEMQRQGDHLTVVRGFPARLNPYRHAAELYSKQLPDEDKNLLVMGIIAML